MITYPVTEQEVKSEEFMVIYLTQSRTMKMVDFTFYSEDDAEIHIENLRGCRQAFIIGSHEFESTELTFK